jgi:hypothetical protein
MSHPRIELEIIWNTYSEDERMLRKMLAFAYSGSTKLYGDDGELQDYSEMPGIDYVRDTVREINDKMNTRGINKLIASGYYKVKE